MSLARLYNQSSSPVTLAVILWSGLPHMFKVLPYLHRQASVEGLIMTNLDFHPRLIGLTSSYDAVKATCKTYRVYFSTPPNTKPGDDYLFDHSIFFYLMNPEGY